MEHMLGGYGGEGNNKWVRGKLLDEEGVGLSEMRRWVCIIM